MLTRLVVTWDQMENTACTVPKVIHTLCTVRWIGVSRTVIGAAVVVLGKSEATRDAT